MQRLSFTRKERLKKNSLIRDVFEKGIAVRGRFINVYLLKRDTGPYVNRVAFISKRNLYNKKKVLRNRFRRVLKEAYRKTKYLLLPGHDIVILATNITKDTKSTHLQKELTYAFKRGNKK